MKFFNSLVLFLFILFCSCCKKNNYDINKIFPEYRLIKDFSERVKQKQGFTLCAYGTNVYLPKDYEKKNHTAQFLTNYYLIKNRIDFVSMDEARVFLVSLAESFLKEINFDLEVKERLEFYPCNSDMLHMRLSFQDSNRINLGQGIAIITFYEGKLRYKGYEIWEYRGSYPARGRDFLIHEETYAEALDIVKKQGRLIDLSS